MAELWAAFVAFNKNALAYLIYYFSQNIFFFIIIVCAVITTVFHLIEKVDTTVRDEERAI